jgi:hypothetical protein
MSVYELVVSASAAHCPRLCQSGPPHSVAFVLDRWNKLGMLSLVTTDRP